MIQETVRAVGRKLERLTRRQVPINRSFEMLERKAHSLEELVVIEVMRESCWETGVQQRKIAS